MQSPVDLSAKAKSLAVFLCLLGIGLAFYSLQHHLQYVQGVSGPSFCNINQHINCDAVNGSEWSVFLGIPLASYGMFFYLVIAAILLLGSTKLLPRDTSERASFILIFISCLIAVGLFLLSELAIGALCLLCIGTYLVNFLLFLIFWKGRDQDLSLKARLYLGIESWFRFLGSLLGIKSTQEEPRIFSAWLGLIGIGVIGAGLLFLEKALTPPPTNSPQSILINWLGAPTTQFNHELLSSPLSDYQKGTPGAKIEIVEFADFECPACRRLHPVLDDVLKQFEGSYHFIFRNYPLDRSCNPAMQADLHHYACSSAELVRCAGEQGKFWEALDYVFETPLLDEPKDDPSLSKEISKSLVKDLSLDQQGLDECLKSKRQLASIRKDLSEGDRVGLQSTPSIWVNGRLVKRPTPEGLTLIFNHILKK